MKPKILIIVIVLLVVLFAVTLGVGATRPSGPAGDEPPAWLARPGDLLLKKQALTTDDLQSALPAGCAQSLQQRIFKLSGGDACILFFKESSASLRSLPLHLVAGRAVVSFDPFGEKRMKARRELGLGSGDKRDMQVQAFKEGGELRLSCLSGEQCVIEVREKD